MLPDNWMERIFQRMEDFYGSKWSSVYGAFPRERVKKTWADELSGFIDRPDAIAVALKSLGQFPPTLPEFQAMCRDYARRSGETIKSLPHMLTQEQQEAADKAADEVAEKARTAFVRGSDFDHKGWAKNINRRYLEGDKTLLSVVVQMAQNALDDRWVEK